MSKSLRRLVVLLGILAVAIVAWFLVRPDPIPVDAVSVARGRIDVTIDQEGRTRVIDRRTVSAPVTGTVAEIALEAGDRVHRGDAVAVLSPVPLDPRGREQAEARLQAAIAAERAARAAVMESEAHRDQARRDRERLESLASAGHVAAREIEHARTAELSATKLVEAAGFRADAAACEVENARAALMLADPATAPAHDVITVTSPCDGTVLRVFDESARTVVAGEPLLEIGDPTRLEIVIDVLSEDAVAIQPGAPVALHGWGGPDELRAVVRLVEPSAFTKVSPLGVEEQRVHVIADFVASAPGLGDGYRVEAAILVDSRENALLVPASALFRTPDGEATFVVREGAARQVAVTTGLRSSRSVEVLEGLQPGDRVITHPDERIEDGTRVRPSSGS